MLILLSTDRLDAVKAHEQAAAAAVQGAVLHSRSHGAQFRHEAATLRAAIAKGRAAVISYDARAVKAQQELGFLQVCVPLTDHVLHNNTM
jgi:hypothetical protein